MPNWVLNILEIEGDSNEILNCLDYIKDENNYISFQKIKPRPSELDIESGTISNISYAVYKYLNDPNDCNDLLEYLKYPWVKNAGISNVKDLIDYLISNNRYDADLGYRVHKNILDHGCSDWYTWNLTNWGTKWESSESYVSGSNVIFETAWSAPFPIIEEISKKFSNLKFILKWADEDIGSNCGIAEFNNGTFKIVEEESILLACNIRGLDPAEYDYSYARDKKIDSIIKND